MAAYLVKIDEFLRTPGPIDNTCSLIEEKTKIQRKYIGVGVGIITMGLIFSTFAPLVVNLIAFVYPAYKSIKVNDLIYLCIYYFAVEVWTWRTAKSLFSITVNMVNNNF